MNATQERTEGKRMKKKNGHAGKMEKQLKQWGAKLDDLVVKAEGAGTDVKAGCHKDIDELKVKYHAAHTKFTEFKAAGSENWETFKTDVGSTWNDLEVAFKKLTD